MTLADSPETPTPAPEWPLEPPRLLRVLAKRPYAVLALLGLLLWLPGILSLPALDRDESRFAQSSRQMVDSGDLVDIRFGQVPRYKKPVGIYWLQAAATRLAGMGDDSHIWTYRLPSLLGSIAASWGTLWCALAFASAEIALTAGLLMLGSVLLTAEATIATTDAVLLACIVVVQGVLLRVYRAAREPDAPSVRTAVILGGWAAFAGGILIKGPVVLGVAALTLIGVSICDREWRWLGGLKPVRGLLLTALLILPWLVAITIQSHGAFFEQSLGNDFAAKMAGGQESHGQWPGYYLLLSAASLWPAILFVLPGIALGVARFGESAIRFLLVWAGGWWVLVEAVPTKLPHYVLPVYPALAILAALFIWTAMEKSPWLTAARWIAILQFVIGLVGMVTALVMLPRYFDFMPPWWLLTLAGVGGALALTALVLLFLRKQGWALALALAAMFVFVPALTVGVGPRLTPLWISERLKPLVVQYTQPGDPPPALAGYQEPSLVFALGAEVLLTDGAGAADAGAHNGGLALVEDAEQGAFFARLAELQTDAAAQGELSGFNYSRGKPVHITLYRVAQLKDVP